jgi:hypothetical protein
MRYNFHIRLRGELHPDREGIELPDIAEAQAEAEKIARELSDDLILDVGSAEANAVEVAGSASNILFNVLMCGPIQPVSI